MDTDTQAHPIELNPEQQRAVIEGDGPALVLAGAGSGKTRVIVERLAWLIGERGVDPRRILGLTFTNKAAGEMRQRVAVRLGRERIGAWLGTFHSFGLFVLRRDMDALGRDPNFTVFDDADQLSLMKRLVKDLDGRYVRVSPRDALSWISRRKQDLKHPDADDVSSAEDEAYLALWSKYHGALAQAGAVDFDDLLCLVARLLRDHEQVRARYQHRYRYVHVDEYQDTNHAQYEIVRLLCEGHGNLFVVGDEDQSIYSWRGASIRNILDFERDFPNAKVFRLERNYRSTQAILGAANALVSHNAQRLGKTLWTERKGGDKVRLYEAHDGEDEADFVARDIVETSASEGVGLGDIGVLFRTNGQARLIEEALRRHRVPYVVIGGIKFYGRKEIKDVLAYLRLLVNPRDDVSLRRVLNVPPRGIGGTSMARLEQYVAERGVTLMETLRDIEHDQTFAGRARESVAQFVHMIDDLALMAKESEDVTPVLDALLERTGYREFVERSDEADSRTRAEMIDEFRSACAQADAAGAKGLQTFLQDLALLSDVDEWEPGTPVVTLMTCHSAKGLEFEHVYLTGLEEGLLPHASSLDSEDELEEERRLCYVAMTRARARLTLTMARSRLMYGERGGRERSRFLDELPGGDLDVLTGGGERRGAGAGAGAAKPSGRGSPMGAERPAATDVGQIKMGVKVRHAKFGVGTVMYTSGSGKRLKARIRFQTGRSRDFMVNAAPLEILEGDRR